MSFEGRILVKGNRKRTVSRTLVSSVGLSFWGGIDQTTGFVTDGSHPWHGRSVVDHVLVLPSGRGSCTASQVLLELIMNKKGPAAIVLRDVDGLLCVGALVAQQVFAQEHDIAIPDILCLGTEKFNQLLERDPDFASVTSDGQLVVGNSIQQVQEELANVESRQVPNDSLTTEEQAMLDASTTEAERMALRVLFRYAQIMSPTPSRRYVEIKQAHIDGCTYIGPAGLEFVQRLVQAGGQVKVPTTLNSVSADRQQWQALGVPVEYATASMELGDAYLALGCRSSSFTCAPYLLDDPPQLGQDVAWGESNAVVYANSILGARTEKYADYLDICCALVGKTIQTGVHLPENRLPQVILDARKLLLDLWKNHQDDSGLDALFPTLGHLCGTKSDGLVPILIGMEGWSSYVTLEHLKAFSAALGTTGTSPLIHIAGITPESKDEAAIEKLIANCNGRRHELTIQDLVDTYNTLNSTTTSNTRVDLVALGNPHLSLEEVRTLSNLIPANQTKHGDLRIMACMSRTLFAKAQELGYTDKLEHFGTELIHDTCWCMLLDPPVIPARTDATIMTPSAKYAHYGPGLTGRRFRYGSMADCVEAAIHGAIYSSKGEGGSARLPTWLSSGTFQQTRHYSSSIRHEGLVVRRLLRRVIR